MIPYLENYCKNIHVVFSSSYWQLRNAVDFIAPKGTPVLTAADVIEAYINFEILEIENF